MKSVEQVMKLLKAKYPLTSKITIEYHPEVCKEQYYVMVQHDKSHNESYYLSV